MNLKEFKVICKEMGYANDYILEWFVNTYVKTNYSQEDIRTINRIYLEWNDAIYPKTSFYRGPFEEESNY